LPVTTYQLLAITVYQRPAVLNSLPPTLSLPTYSGDPLTWLSLWDSFFAAIHSNPTLSGIQKFNHLKVLLQGDAARAIEGLPLWIYIHAISLLQDPFGQTHKLINAHMTSLTSMASPTNSLESKLTLEVRTNLAREHSNTKWILSDLMAALQREIRVLEYGLHDLHSPIPKISATAVFQVGARDDREHSTTTRKKKTPVCASCKGPHSSHSCEIVTDYQKHVSIFKRDNLCFN